MNETCIIISSIAVINLISLPVLHSTISKRSTMTCSRLWYKYHKRYFIIIRQTNTRYMMQDTLPQTNTQNTWCKLSHITHLIQVTFVSQSPCSLLHPAYQMYIHIPKSVYLTLIPSYPTYKPDTNFFRILPYERTMQRKNPTSIHVFYMENKVRVGYIWM